jgi:hypothetical protein
MPLIIKEHSSRSGRLVSRSVQGGSLGRIVSGMKVSALQSEPVELNSFMRDMSVLFSQNQVHSVGAESSVQ